MNRAHEPIRPETYTPTSYYAPGGGYDGLVYGIASNVAGVTYAAVTMLIVDAVLGDTVVALSVVVGVFMFVASLHEHLPVLSFTPGGLLATRRYSASTRPAQRPSVSRDCLARR